MRHGTPTLQRKFLDRYWRKPAVTAPVRARTDEPGAVRRPDPHWRGAAADAQKLSDDEWMLEGGAETGKTFAGLWRLDQELRTTPYGQGVLARKVRQTLYGSAVQTLYKIHAWRAGDGVRVVPYGGQEPKFFDYHNDVGGWTSRLWLAGLDKPGKALSSERDWVFVNQAEELTLEDWETLTTRTTGRAGHAKTPWLAGDCNPGGSQHWIKRRGSIRLLASRHQDNPTLYEDDRKTLTPQGRKTIGRLSKLTGIRRARLFEHRWASAEGAVYEFDPVAHLVDRPAVGRDWTVLLSIDFGYTAPFVAQWWAIDPDGRMYLVREIYHSRRTVRVHAEQIEQLERDSGIAHDHVVADHDAEDRATMHEAGIWTQPAEKEKGPGLEAVKSRLVVQPDGRPRLFLCRGALVERDEELEARYLPVCTEQEFDGYVYALDAAGKPKEEPVKKDDHGMDAMRYAAMWADRHFGHGDVQIDLPEGDGRVWADRAPQGVFLEDDDR